MHESKNEFYEQAKTELIKKHGKVEQKINRLFDLRLEEDDQSITKDMFAYKLKELKEEQAEVRTKLAEYDKADEKFYITANTVLNLARYALEIFKSSEANEKRQLLKYRNLKYFFSVISAKAEIQTYIYFTGFPICLRVSEPRLGKASLDCCL